MKNRCRKQRESGFTYVEALVAILIISVILLFMQHIFTSAVQQTIKGTSLIATIKEANDLFSSLRKDLLGAGVVYTRNAAGNSIFYTLSPTASELPNPTSFEYPAKIDFVLSETSTASYKLTTLPNGKMEVTRVLSVTNKKDMLRHFAVPKMRLFRALLILQEHYLKTTPLETRHLFVEIELQNDDPKATKKSIRLSTFFSPTNLGLSAWNYLYVRPLSP